MSYYMIQKNWLRQSEVAIDVRKEGTTANLFSYTVDLAEKDAKKLIVPSWYKNSTNFMYITVFNFLNDFYIALFQSIQRCLASIDFMKIGIQIRAKSVDFSKPGRVYIYFENVKLYQMSVKGFFVEM